MPKNSKRFQVDVFPDKKKQLEELRRDCQKAGIYVPSLPNLIDRALAHALPKLREEYLPK